jgi:hypothetical protein
MSVAHDLEMPEGRSGHCAFTLSSTDPRLFIHGATAFPSRTRRTHVRSDGWPLSVLLWGTQAVRRTASTTTSCGAST